MTRSPFNSNPASTRMLFPPPFPHESHIAPSKTFLATFHPSAFIPSNAGSWNDKSSWLDGSSNYYTPTWQTRSCHAKFSELLEKEFWKEDTPGVVRTLMMYVCWCCFALEQFALEVECEIWTRDRRLVEASWERGGGQGGSNRGVFTLPKNLEGFELCQVQAPRVNSL